YAGVPSIRFVGNSTASNVYPFMVRASSNNSWRTYIDYAGNIYSVNTSITALSDVRLKENIRDLETGLDIIAALKPRRFDWKEGKGQDKKDVAGFIAQEVETVFPEMVSESLDEDENGGKYKTVAPGMLIPTLVKAIQELKAEIDVLKGQT
ncbi:MAG: tail fiber domain-containing protein, partial [Burkholderiaceae bacterium]|nr:tail fiber domain-containing protein [Burkholderiaceae bacterium]